MKRIFVAMCIAAGLFVLSTSPVVKRWTGSYLAPVSHSVTVPAESAADTAPLNKSFKCDGRKYCSQMTSCPEAKSFLKNCPGMEMDGDGDGIPCESQWCKNGF
jgi:alpha/beta superfamily hydrolase